MNRIRLRSGTDQSTFPCSLYGREGSVTALFWNHFRVCIADIVLHPGLYRVCYVFLTTDNVLDMYNPPAGNSACPPNARAQSPTATPAIRAEITRVVGEAKQQLPVLVVGEAQHLRNDILEDLRLLILAFLHDLTDAFASQYFPQVRRNCDVFNQRPDIERTRHDGQLDLFEDVGVPF